MRWSAILALAAALASLVVADRLAPEQDAPMPSTAAQPVAVGYRGTGDDGGTWFCVGAVGGTAGSIAEVIIVNTSPREMRAAIRFYPAVPLGGRSRHWPAVRSEVIVAPHSRFALSAAGTVARAVADLAAFDEVFVASEVTLDAPGGVVLQQVSVGGATDIGPCLTAASPEWYFAVASTRRDARVRLSLLNPYADDAVVDIAFVTDEGAREPVAYKGVVVPANALVVLDLGSEVTRRAQMSFSVVARTGNVLASRLQSFSGGLGLSGVSLSAGALRAEQQWLFPLGVAGADAGAANSFVLYNPNAAEARVDLTVELDASLRARGVPPFELTIPPGQRVEVAFFPHLSGKAHPVSGVSVLQATTRLLASERYWVSVRSFNGVAVVVERLRTGEAGLPNEVSILGGRTAGATRGMLALPNVDGHPGTVAVVNPSLETISRLSLEVLTGRGWGPLEGFEDLEIRPRRRLLLDLGGRIPADTLALRFDASEPLVASYSGPAGVRAMEIVPELEGLAALELLLF